MNGNAAFRNLSDDAPRPWARPGAPPTMLFKHSPLCGTSAMAADHVAAFAARHPECPVWRVDVIRQRDLSQELARELSIGHESPQVILIRDGKAVASLSHFQVKTAALERLLTPAD